MTATTRPLRIAVWHNLPSGGGKRALYNHVKGLLERGHSIEAWCPPTADQTFLPLGDLITEHVVPLRWDQSKRRNLIARARAVVDLVQAMEVHCRQCAAEINRGRFDVVFANSCRFLCVPPLARFVAAPSVIYLAEPFRALYEAMPRLPWAALPWPASPAALLKDAVKVQGLRVQVREEARNAAAFDRILTNSFFSRESILRAYGLEARVCYLGVDTDLFVDQGQPRQDFVVGISAIAPEKNIEQVIEGLALLPPPRPRLVWVGHIAAPRYFAALKQMASARGVQFEPRLKVTDEELVGILNRAAMMVHTPRLEPFGLAPLEANACATPVVAVAEGGLRETIVDGVNGLLVDHSLALPSAIERLLGDVSYARQLGQQGAALVRERWSLSAAIDRLEERLSEAAGGKRA